MARHKNQKKTEKISLARLAAKGKKKEEEEKEDIRHRVELSFNAFLYNNNTTHTAIGDIVQS